MGPEPTRPSFSTGGLEMTDRERAKEPEDLARLFVQYGNARDAEGLAELYAPDAVLGFPPGHETVGRAAIRGILEQMLAAAPRFELEEPLPTLRHADLALTWTRPTTPAAESRSRAGSRTGRGCGSSTAPNSPGSLRNPVEAPDLRNRTASAHRPGSGPGTPRLLHLPGTVTS